MVRISLPELEQLRVAHLATISTESRLGMKPYIKVRSATHGGIRVPEMCASTHPPQRELAGRRRCEG